MTAPTKPEEPLLELTITRVISPGGLRVSRRLPALLDRTYPGIHRWLEAQVAELLEGE